MLGALGDGIIAGQPPGPAIYQDDVGRFHAALKERLEDKDWLSSDERFDSRERAIATRLLVHELGRSSYRPRRLVRAAFASLVAPPPVMSTQVNLQTPTGLLSMVAADLLSRLLEEPDELEITPSQAKTLLTIAADSAARRRDPSRRAREGEYRPYEIPFALSPRIRADRLEEVIGSARAVALLPLAGGAVEATTCLGQGQFVVAGEYALGGTVISMILAAGVALAERMLAAGQPDRGSEGSPPGGSGGDETGTQ